MPLQSNVGKITEGKTLSLEALVNYLPELKEVPKMQLENWAKDAASVRTFEKGDIICEEGSFGSTAFYIVSGKVEIFIANPLAHIETTPSVGHFMGRTIARMKSVLSTALPDREPAGRRKFIPVDASIDLPVNRPIGQLGPGELFGEMTCRTFQPRSATVRALEDCVMVEMLRVILDMLMGSREVSDAIKTATKVKAPTFKGTSFKKTMDEKYRQRSLVTHLRTVSLFETVSEEFMQSLSQRVELVPFGKNQVICRQGDEADAFYLIRHGMVKVSQNLAGGEMVRTYLSRGEVFGEMGLIMNQPRIATCTALDSVDVVKISSADFKQMLAEYPQFYAEIEEIAHQRLTSIAPKELPAGLSMDEFLDQGLFEAQNLLLIDLDKCTRCDLCVQSCAEAHDGISRLLRDGLRYDKYLVATACRSCRDPLCMTQCPVGSIRRTDNLEIIIENWCIGCTKCAELCPYGNINMQPVEEKTSGYSMAWTGSLAAAFGLRKKAVDAPDAAKPKKAPVKATTCDLCTEMSTPSCVYACPHDAAKRVDPSTFFSRKMPKLLTEKSGQVRYDPRTTHKEAE